MASSSERLKCGNIFWLSWYLHFLFITCSSIIIVSFYIEERNTEMYFKMLGAQLQVMIIKTEGTDAGCGVLGFHGNENSYCILLGYVTVLIGR
jgi:hypothetical protein